MYFACLGSPGGAGSVYFACLGSPGGAGSVYFACLAYVFGFAR
ncbi:MAG: hypothetical protein WCP98_23080 [Actinomycetes bacterium]